MAIGAVVLERTGGVDHEVGRLRAQAGGDVAAVKRQRQHPCLPLVAGTECCRPPGVAAADQKLDPRDPGQQRGEAAAEHPVAAQDHDTHRPEFRYRIRSR